MRKKTVVTTSATLAAVEYPTADYNSPFTRGNECILCIAKSADYDAGTLLIRGDNAKDGSYANIHNAVSDAGTAGQADLITYNITLGDNIEVTTGTYAAGTLEIFLLNN